MGGLTLSGIRKAFGDVESLRGLDLEVADGELVVIVGPSGSGKTTALRVAAGLEVPDAGSVRIAEREVTSTAPVDRDVAMVFQDGALFPHLDVAGNIAFGLRVRRVGRAEVTRRARAAARAVGCEALLGRRTWSLSGGERSRVALARAFAREPEVFLLDEPLSNLDAQVRAELRVEVRRLQRRAGVTMVHVTHDQFEALTLGDRVGVLHEGVLHQLGAPEEIYGRPADRVVAQSIGWPSMNVLPARLEADGIRAGPFVMTLTPAIQGRVRRLADEPIAGHEVGLDFGVRPEHVRVGSAEAAGFAEAVVELVEVVGPDAFVHLNASADSPVAEPMHVLARVPGEDRPRPGERVGVAASPARAYVFDAASGATLAALP
jgi:ABC-type sugar transport system ATPase subunit